jgi:hypothetical protein
MKSVESRRLVCGAVAAASIALTSACTSSGTIRTAAPASPSTSSGATSPTPATETSSSAPSSDPTTTAATAPAGGTLTTEQLKAAQLADGDIPGYTVDRASDSTDVTTGRAKITSGGAVCQKFQDATDGLAPVYGTVAEADRLWADADGLTIQFALMAFPSADKAKAVVADTRASVPGCKKLTEGSGSEVYAISPSALPDIKIGDSSTAFISDMDIKGTPVVLTVGLVQVGSTAFIIAIGGPDLDKAAAVGKVAALKELATKQAAKLRALQKG